MVRPKQLGLLEELKRRPVPCLGSGCCCKQSTCDVGARKHGAQAPCPSLTYDEGAQRYFCGEVLALEGDARVAMMKTIGVGTGCCSNMNSDRSDYARSSYDWKEGDPCTISVMLMRFDCEVGMVVDGRVKTVMLADAEIDLDRNNPSVLFYERMPNKEEG